MSEDPFEELVPECYICFEPCSRKSKCKCQTYVHKKCIENYLLTTGSEHCQVCLYKFKQSKTFALCSNADQYFLYLFKCIVVYILSGILGQLIFYLAAKENIVIVAPWTDIFALSSIAVISTSVFLYAFVKRYKIITL